ncbi:conserved domain protein [Clostridium botulinum B str. Eklund 17B (NRP)]|uniref:Conserved domain protein n=1 Tax=Clostridium botulinum (strain Eklund 17B / Type B) TaxID=935198 RepID=B2TJ98_CLOBB|nr:conserved domain protein [Clostridium botulinum B str. Eklund 17B (NRP)]MBN1038235.1 hypothetical protein [Clostridium botulinum]MBN1054895.1 hypothetical protein [Clostridium botulinum]MBY6974862.1 hypothetical protein [Clostridium botulinum]MBY6999842.1 hypothetical protein [Clostridium botulinum]
MNFELEKIKKINLILNSLCIFKDLLNDDVISSYKELISYLNKNEFDINNLLNYYNTFTYNLIEKSEELSIRKYIIDKILMGDNILKKIISSNESTNKLITKQTRYELTLLEELSNIKSEDIKTAILEKGFLSEFEKSIIKNLITWNEDIKTKTEDNKIEDKVKQKLFSNKNWNTLLEDIIEFYNKYGIEEIN